MKLQQLRSFVAVFEAGSFTAGAARANATQSGVSMQIKDLEQRLGGALFERSVSGVVATEMGRQFYEHATTILRQVSDAEHAMASMHGEVSGNLRIGIIPTLTRTILPPVLSRYTSRYPQVNVAVVEAYSAQLTEDLAVGALDFVIVPAPHSSGEVNASQRLIATDREFLVSAPSRLGHHMQAVDLSQLGPQKLVLPGVANARRRRLNAYIQNHGIQVEAIVELDGMLATLEMVSYSDWKTFLPGLICYADRRGELRQVNPLVVPMNVQYVLMEPNATSLSTAASLFFELFQQELEAQINWYQI